ncbi:MAG: acetylglutamate kinase [Alphaproteobacteria bacterium]
MVKGEQNDIDALLLKAGVLSEALPFLRRYSGKTFVVKYGGHAMGNEELVLSFAGDIVLLKQVGINPIVVHGGGPQIGAMLDRLQIKSEFVDGLRVTGKATVEVVEMVLSGSINKSLVTAVNRMGGLAVGLSGKDGNLIQARKLERRTRDNDSNIERALDLGFVGEPEKIDPRILKTLAASEIIPVIAPIGVGKDGETYNINADTVAGAIAASVSATRLVMLTDVPGVKDKSDQLIPDMTTAQARVAIEDGTVHGGMIPKVETCVKAVEAGVEAAVITNGRTEHAVLLELFTEGGFGTAIWQGAEG